MAEFSREAAVWLWRMPVKGSLRLGLLPRGVHCRHNAVSGCKVDSRLGARMVGITAIPLAEPRNLSMERLAFIPAMRVCEGADQVDCLLLIVVSRANSPTPLPVETGKAG